MTRHYGGHNQGGDHFGAGREARLIAAREGRPMKKHPCMVCGQLFTVPDTDLPFECGECVDKSLRAKAAQAALDKLTQPAFKVGDEVQKAAGGDYQYEGTIVGVIRKLSGAIRYVIEDSRGLLFIMNEKQLLKK